MELVNQPIQKPEKQTLEQFAESQELMNLWIVLFLGIEPQLAEAPERIELPVQQHQILEFLQIVRSVKDFALMPWLVFGSLKQYNK
jgi:hypothetical protein